MTTYNEIPESKKMKEMMKYLENTEHKSPNSQIPYPNDTHQSSE